MKPFYSSEIGSYEWNKDRCNKGLIDTCEKHLACIKQAICDGKLSEPHESLLTIKQQCPHKYLKEKEAENNNH